MLHEIITRTMKLLTRRGVSVEEEGSTNMADNDGDSDELVNRGTSFRVLGGSRLEVSTVDNP